MAHDERYSAVVTEFGDRIEVIRGSERWIRHGSVLAVEGGGILLATTADDHEAWPVPMSRQQAVQLAANLLTAAGD